MEMHVKSITIQLGLVQFDYVENYLEDMRQVRLKLDVRCCDKAFIRSGPKTQAAVST